MQSVHYHSSLEPLLDTLPFYIRYIFTLPPCFCKGTRPFQLLISILAFRPPKKRPRHPHSAATKHILSFATCLLSPPFPLNPSYPNLPPRISHVHFSQSKKKQIQSHLYHQTPKLRRISDAPITFASRRCHCPTIVGLGSADGHRQHSTVFQNCYLFELDVRVFG
jgi:hypothetical protein